VLLSAASNKAPKPAVTPTANVSDTSSGYFLVFDACPSTVSHTLPYLPPPLLWPLLSPLALMHSVLTIPVGTTGTRDTRRNGSPEHHPRRLYTHIVFHNDGASLRSAAWLRLRNAMRSASAIYNRHHWYHTTSKPDSSSGERGLWPPRARKVAVCEGCAGSQACKVPSSDTLTLTISTVYNTVDCTVIRENQKAAESPAPGCILPLCTGPL
jgi:hypothetical protein